jgi:hypothetical protein
LECQSKRLPEVSGTEIEARERFFQRSDSLWQQSDCQSGQQSDCQSERSRSVSRSVSRSGSIFGRTGGVLWSLTGGDFQLTIGRQERACPPCTGCYRRHSRNIYYTENEPPKLYTEIYVEAATLANKYILLLRLRIYIV